MIHVRFASCWLFGLALLASPLAAIAAMAEASLHPSVIVHPSVNVRSINSSSLRNIYTLRQTTWTDRQAIVMFVLPDNHPTHEAFAKEILGLYPYRLRQIWDRLSYSGMASAPIEVKDESELRARVRATPGAIGYSSKDTGHDGIKTLTLE